MYKVICFAHSNDPRMDSSVRQLIWNGAIPLEIHIDDPENIYILNSGAMANLPFYVSGAMSFI